jgi:hypothetical protein
MYALLEEGAMMSLLTPGLPVGIKIAARAWLVAPDPVVVSVQLPEATEAVADPAIESSTNSVMLSFTTVPHVPDNSPVTGRANPKREV